VAFTYAKLGGLAKMTRLQRSLTEQVLEDSLPGSRLLDVWRAIDWDPVAAELEASDGGRQARRRGGPTPWPALVVFRALLLQHWFQLSLGEIEHAMAYRYDFAVFVGIEPGHAVPSGSTLCRARARWRAKGERGEALLTRCGRIVVDQLAAAGIRVVPRRAPVLDLRVVTWRT
jgi:IS5 family transposase